MPGSFRERCADLIYRDLLNPMYQRYGQRDQFRACLTEEVIKNLDAGMRQYDVNQTIEPLPIPSELRTFFGQEENPRLSCDPIRSAHELVDRLDQLQHRNGDGLSTHQYARLLKCVFLFGRVKDELITKQLSKKSHWPSFTSVIKQVWTCSYSYNR